MSVQDRDYEMAESFLEFYRDYYRDEIGELAASFPKDQQSLYVDAKDVYRYDPDLLDDWIAHHSRVTATAEQALADFDVPIPTDLSDATVRLTDRQNYLDAYTVAGLSHEDIGELVAVSGQLSRVTDKSPRVLTAAWECACGVVEEYPCTRTEVPEPHECQGCERQGPFSLNEQKSEWTDQRKIKLEEPIEERSKARGESVPVYVEDDLVDYGPGETTLPDHAGKQATIIGKVHVDESQLSGRNGGTESELWIDAVAIVLDGDGETDIDIEAHREDFEAFAAKDDAPELVAESLAPSLQASEGDDLYDARRAVAAWLFNAYRLDPDNGGSKRGDLHMALIGDPGTGKSSLMSYVNDVLPQSEYRSGTGLSEVGLTAAAVQEEFAGTTEWTLQPGILPRADGGHCIIDEIDGVVDSDTKAIHDALEGEQMVKTDKAGIKADLPTRCALLAGGNPTYTRFDRHEPIAEQIDLDPALIDRMDLLFAMEDEVDEDRDEDKAAHALDAFDGLSQAEAAERTGQQAAESEDTVADPPVPQDTLRAWVAYARQEVFPTLTPEVKQELKEFYVELRNLNDGYEDDGTTTVPAGMRTLEAGIRLSIAFARLRLSDTVGLEDVQRAKDLTRNVVGLNYDADADEFNADKQRGAGKPTSQKERREIVRGIVDDADGEVSMQAIRARADEAGIDPDKAESDIDHWMQKGEMYEPQTNHYDTT